MGIRSACDRGASGGPTGSIVSLLSSHQRTVGAPVDASFIDGGRPATFIPAIIFTFYSKIAREDEEQAEAA